MDDIFSKLDERRKWLDSLPDGVPCDHAGCLSHISHPCEGCGRVGGKRLTPRAADVCPECKGKGIVKDGSGVLFECSRCRGWG